MTISRFWREIDQRYNLRGVTCGNCGGSFFPARTLCPKCRHLSIGKLSPCDFSGNGTVEAFSVVHQPPAGFELQAPYVVAIVRLDEGPRVTSQVVDVAPVEVRVGLRVRKVFRRINEEGEAGVVHYGFKFARA
ncbi:MAG TPA: Zn-ribbon domain-containing OB-fold protein [Candidatus Thermoplasmatota archaeon]|nr:Zn-ribbon domain-containing OB-fold protein [Candidatus Thermoplasmatota archaeon]